MTPFDEAAARVSEGADHHVEAAELVRQMTREEKLDCLDGDLDCWPGLGSMASGDYHRRPWPAARVQRLGIPGIEFADGPRGCVIDPATAFPVSMARGATFDPELEERIGEAIGAELRARGATFTGAVCMNLLRHPGWGRAQETYGEDPHHVGEMAAALTRGLQRHVMACMKHFACNSIENARFQVDVTCDERPLHEVYLPHFRRVAAEGVASVMSAYNSLNGTWCGDNPDLLDGILRDEWDWDGFVITDFIFGLRDPIGSVAAGCEIEMPFRQQRAHTLTQALDAGELDEATVDRAVTRIVATLLRFADRIGARPDPSVVEAPAHLALAREASAASTVLLRNQHDLLPVAPGDVRRVAVVGRLAAVPNLGDGGSSNVHPTRVVTPLDGIRAAFPDARVVHVDDDSGAAEGADLVVVVVGYTAEDEGEYLGADTFTSLFHLFPPLPSDGLPDEMTAGDASGGDAGGAGDPGQSFLPGGDRRSLRLRPEDEELIRAAVSRAGGPNRVVVAVMAGSAVVMPWAGQVGAILQIWYPGAEGGHALGDMLTGAAEPGGRLPFAVPTDEAHLVDFDPDATTITYGLLHGQWWLDQQGIEPAYPFGYGLGYTTFDVVASAPRFGSDGASGTVTARVTNTGARPGSTVVQVYGSLPGSEVERPLRRLLGFRRVAVDAGAAVDMEIEVDLETLAVRDGGKWRIEPGDYRIEVGTSARDLVASFDVQYR